MRTYLTLVVIIIDTIVIGSIVALAGIFDRGGRVYDVGARLWARAVRVCAGIKVDIKGLEHLDKSKSYIFMSNHQSHLDAVAWAPNLPFRIRFFAKKELTYVPIFGQAIGIPVSMASTNPPFLKSPIFPVLLLVPSGNTRTLNPYFLILFFASLILLLAFSVFFLSMMICLPI